MKRNGMILSLCTLLFAAPALAGQKLYVLNEGNNSLTVIDSWTGAVLGDFNTKSNPRDIDAAHHAEFVVIAGSNDLGLAHSQKGYQRMDLQFRNAGSNSTAIGLSPDDRYIYLAQTDPDRVYRIDLLWGGWFQDGCMDMDLSVSHDCNIDDDALYVIDPRITDPLHMAVCDDGAVYVVGTNGEVARYTQATGFLTLRVSPAPRDPRGIACSPDNGVFIMAGDRTLVELGSGSSPAVTAYPDLPISDPGRIDVDPRRMGQSFQVVLTDREAGELVRVQDGRVVQRLPLWPDGNGNQRLPWAVTANDAGWLGTANQGSDGGMILYTAWAQLPRGNGPQPIDADFGPVLGAAVQADPFSLEFIYGVGGSQSGAQVMQLRSSGTAPLVISRLEITRSSDFSIVREDCTGRSLAPGQTCEVTIAFTNPGGNGAPGHPHFSGDLRVHHNGSPIYINDFPLKAIHFKEYLAGLEEGELSFVEEPGLELR